MISGLIYHNDSNNMIGILESQEHGICPVHPGGRPVERWRQRSHWDNASFHLWIVYRGSSVFASSFCQADIARPNLCLLERHGECMPHGMRKPR